ncbi:MAG TPA: hypothetical protein VK588_08530, partial [Chitinophagaceae bacterium]|nr:hypothetical protein [Chitinophagaceae bacterium]
MRKRLHYFILTLFISFLFNTFIHSQDRFAYAITDINPTAGSWTVLRKLNLQTGTYSDALLNGLDTKLAVYDAVSKRQIDATLSNTASMAF